MQMMKKTETAVTKVPMTSETVPDAQNEAVAPERKQNLTGLQTKTFVSPGVGCILSTESNKRFIKNRTNENKN